MIFMINGFTAESWRVKLLGIPVEDAYYMDEHVGTIAVADGVSRDWDLTRNKLTIPFKYEKPSHAKIAADLFTHVSLSVLRDFIVKDQRAIIEAYRRSNEAIGNYARQQGITPENTDYLLRDLPGCVSSLAVLNKNAIYYGFIADCGVALVDARGNLLLKTPDEGPNSVDKDKHIWSEIRETLGERAGWSMPEARKMQRSQFRNNPKEGNSYGVLTGEKNALYYLKTGTIEVKPEYTLLVYTDGVEPILFLKDVGGGDIRGEVADFIRNRDFCGIERLCKKNVKSEGTLAYGLFESELDKEMTRTWQASARAERRRLFENDNGF